MRAEGATMEHCGEKDCGRDAPLTIRVEAAGGDAQFKVYCKRHFDTAVEFVRAFWLERESGPAREAGWGCCREGCQNKAVMTFRIRTEEGPEMMSFCREHLCVAFEIAAQIRDAEAA